LLAFLVNHLFELENRDDLHIQELPDGFRFIQKLLLCAGLGWELLLRFSLLQSFPEGERQ